MLTRYHYAMFMFEIKLSYITPKKNEGRSQTALDISVMSS